MKQPRTIITKGTVISSSEGFMVMEDFNGHIVYVTEHETDEDGMETGKTYERMLTLSEIAHVLHDFNGRTFSTVEWEDEREEEE